MAKNATYLAMPVKLPPHAVHFLESSFHDQHLPRR